MSSRPQVLPKRWRAFPPHAIAFVAAVTLCVAAIECSPAEDAQLPTSKDLSAGPESVIRDPQSVTTLPDSPATDKSTNRRSAPPAADHNPQSVAPSIKTIDAKELAELIKAAKGKVVVVNFWATWCPPCVHEMPDLLKFYEANKEKSVQFLSISADGPGAIDDRVRPFMTEKKLSFPVYALDVGSPDEIAEALKIDFEGTLPATLVYDSAGKLAKFWNEEITLAQLTNTVYPLRPAE